jgi:phage-related protein
LQQILIAINGMAESLGGKITDLQTIMETGISNLGTGISNLGTGFNNLGTNLGNKIDHLQETLH